MWTAGGEEAGIPLRFQLYGSFASHEPHYKKRLFCGFYCVILGKISELIIFLNTMTPIWRSTCDIR